MKMMWTVEIFNEDVIVAVVIAIKQSVEKIHSIKKKNGSFQLN